MGRVTVEALIENSGDLWDAQRGTLTPDRIRAVRVTEALVDTGCTFLGVPATLVRQLGFTRPNSTRTARTTRGVFQSNIYGPVKLTVNGRSCSVDVAEVDDACPVLIGQVPLEILDFVVDTPGQRLIGNPEHGGEHMIDMFADIGTAGAA